MRKVVCDIHKHVWETKGLEYIVESPRELLARGGLDEISSALAARERDVEMLLCGRTA